MTFFLVYNMLEKYKVLNLWLFWTRFRCQNIALKTSSIRYVRALDLSLIHIFRAHETRHDLVCRLLLEKKNKNIPGGVYFILRFIRVSRVTGFAAFFHAYFVFLGCCFCCCCRLWIAAVDVKTSVQERRVVQTAPGKHHLDRTDRSHMV